MGLFYGNLLHLLYSLHISLFLILWNGDRTKVILQNFLHKGHLLFARRYLQDFVFFFTSRVPHDFYTDLHLVITDTFSCNRYEIPWPFSSFFKKLFLFLMTPTLIYHHFTRLRSTHTTTHGYDNRWTSDSTLLRTPVVKLRSDSLCHSGKRFFFHNIPSRI